MFALARRSFELESNHRSRREEGRDSVPADRSEAWLLNLQTEGVQQTASASGGEPEAA